MVAAKEFVSNGAWVSVLALAQSTWVLGSVYGRNAKEVARAVEMLLAHKNLVLQDADAVADALQLFRDRPTLGFADCLMLQLARKAGHVPLGTFDRGLAKADGAQKL